MDDAEFLLVKILKVVWHPLLDWSPVCSLSSSLATHSEGPLYHQGAGRLARLGSG